MTARQSEIERKTKETDVRVALSLDGSRSLHIATGLGFFDHMLTALAFHAGWNLNLIAKGDLDVDDHHTVEDCGIAIGEAIADALQGQPINRFGSKFAPLDESLARAVVDFSGRPHATVELGFIREKIGDVATENLTHFFQSLAMSAKFTLHIDLIRGENDHHKAEAAFKALALAMREALQIAADTSMVPSTKGVL